MNTSASTAFIKKEAARLGFSYCGISRADFLKDEAPKLERWLKAGMHGQMKYMENHFDKRLDPRLLVPGAKSVISLLLNYYPAREHRQRTDAPKISSYAYGEDYHSVIKAKLKELLHVIGENIGEVNGRVFVDSAPVMDKAWAAKSGLGWIGKNTNLINKQSGSFFFIAELITDLVLETDGPVKDFCGECRACIDACPTQALATPYQLDANRCISYLTIELRESIPSSFRGNMDGWMFGCDVCQDVCPWNRFAKANSEDSFKPLGKLNEMDLREWEEMTEEVFAEKFGRSAMTRAGWKGIKRNLDFLKPEES